MRMINKNMIEMQYSLWHDIVPIYQTDSNGDIIYDDIDGESVPRDTGKTRARYDVPVHFTANVNFASQSEARFTAYGIDNTRYDAIVYTARDAFPLDETSIIFINAEPIFAEDGYVERDSADYQIVRVIQSLNYTTYLIRHLERSNYDGD